MKILRNTILTSTAVLLLFIGDAPPDSRFGFQLFPEAHAILGVWRRHYRRMAVIGGAAVASAAVASEAAADKSVQQQAHTDTGEQQPAASQPQATAANPPPKTAAPASAPVAADTGKPLPLGTVVHSLPGGCTNTPVGGIAYYYCGGNFYRAVFQGNSLVYVTAKP